MSFRAFWASKLTPLWTRFFEQNFRISIKSAIQVYMLGIWVKYPLPVGLSWHARPDLAGGRLESPSILTKKNFWPGHWGGGWALPCLRQWRVLQLWPVVFVSVWYANRVGVLLNWLARSSWSLAGGFFQPIMYCVIKELGYLQNNSTSLCNFVLNSGLRENFAIASQSLKRIINIARQRWMLKQCHILDHCQSTKLTIPAMIDN